MAGPAVAIDLAAVEPRVQHTLTLQLQRASAEHARRDGDARFDIDRHSAHGFDGNARHLDVQIESIEQRTREPPAVTLDLLGRASTLAASVSQITTGTRIHRRDQLKARWELRV